MTTFYMMIVTRDRMKVVPYDVLPPWNSQIPQWKYVIGLTLSHDFIKLLNLG